MTEEIHFYADGVPYSEANTPLETVCFHYAETKDALEELWSDKINTIQMCFLADMGRFMAKGIKVFIHDETGDYEIKLGSGNERTTRELREGHNFFKLWESGEFATPVEHEERPDQIPAFHDNGFSGEIKYDREHSCDNCEHSFLKMPDGFVCTYAKTPFVMNPFFAGLGNDCRYFMKKAEERK